MFSSPTPPQPPLFFGDSIAVGYGKNYPGKRREGASPNEIYSYLLEQLKNNPDSFRGRVINLSTGVSNNPSDFNSIVNQFDLLKRSNANKINILGAANITYGKENQKIKEFSDKYGFNFLGGFKPSSDGVHPETYSTYNGQSLSSTFLNDAAPAIAPKEFLDSAVETVLAKLKGITGVLNKETNVFTEQAWNPEEEKRYAYYRNLKGQT